jgi:hypothetical protein
VDNGVPKGLGGNQVMLHGCTDRWISPHWDLEFHIHTYAYNLMVMDVLAQNLIKKCNQLITYASRLFNHVEWNYTTIEKEALAMVYALHNSIIIYS